MSEIGSIAHRIRIPAYQFPPSTLRVPHPKFSSLWLRLIYRLPPSQPSPAMNRMAVISPHQHMNLSSFPSSRMYNTLRIVFVILPYSPESHIDQCSLIRLVRWLPFLRDLRISLHITGGWRFWDIAQECWSKAFVNLLHQLHKLDDDSSSSKLSR